MMWLVYVSNNLSVHACHLISIRSYISTITITIPIYMYLVLFYHVIFYSLRLQGYNSSHCGIHSYLFFKYTSTLYTVQHVQ